ncbi:hypothetical protein K438DRAFT_1809636 [Mycena galopus ATCC 62051]|nr:hypothetical protein K438DRAFT_1809636 [Mycena galopus ATCC 62051]
MSLQKAQVHTPRVTRAAAARQTQLQQQQTNETPAVPDADATSPPRDRKRRRSPPAETPTPAPQRASARQQKQCTEAPVEEAVIPPAVVASTTACPRARSASQESNETLVASTSATSPTSSRAVSVLSADTVVGVEVASNSSKGKGRLIAPASAPPTEDIVAPVGTEVEAGMVTRSRTKRTPFEPKPPRAIPYPANKDAQLAAGRGGPSKRAPTGKRKVAKAKAN